jgi:hypothetical protein
MKRQFPPEMPKHCPCGHSHVSWSAGEDEVYCWDCNKKYSVSACFSPQDRTPSNTAEQDPEN